jgi:hypothetical protein
MGQSKLGGCGRGILEDLEHLFCPSESRIVTALIGAMGPAKACGEAALKEFATLATEVGRAWTESLSRRVCLQ